MLSFAAPAWLLGLLLAPPLLYALHRGGAAPLAVPVARAALWRPAPGAPAAAADRRPPDPAWRRRTLLVALLLLALAGPQWRSAVPRITLWIDDSPSLFTQEAAGQRLALGLAQAQTQLQALPGAEVQWRRLSAPWAPWPVGQAVPPAAAAVSPPPAALMQPGRQHWLLTDGAHPALAAWHGGRAPDRVLQTAGAAGNVGIERLALRRHGGDPARLDLLVRVANGGATDETRELQVGGPGLQPLRQTLALPAGQVRDLKLTLEVNGSLQTLQARLSPGDALALDDEALLDLSAFAPRPVVVDAACPAPLRAALAAHPALRPAAAGEAPRLRVGCGSEAPPGPAPRLHWPAQGLATAVDGPLQWPADGDAADRPRLQAGRLRAFAARPAAGDAVLLAGAGRPLLWRQAGTPPTWVAALDVAALAEHPDGALPLLVDHLLREGIGPELLDPVATLDRGEGAARVRPQALPAPPAGAAVGAAADARVQDLSRYAAVAAALLLLAEALRLGVRAWRQRTAVP